MESRQVCILEGVEVLHHIPSFVAFPAQHQMNWDAFFFITQLKELRCKKRKGFHGKSTFLPSERDWSILNFVIGHMLLLEKRGGARQRERERNHPKGWWPSRSLLFHSPLGTFGHTHTQVPSLCFKPLGPGVKLLIWPCGISCLTLCHLLAHLQGF